MNKFGIDGWRGIFSEDYTFAKSDAKRVGMDCGIITVDVGLQRLLLPRAFSAGEVPVDFGKVLFILKRLIILTASEMTQLYGTRGM